MPERLVDRGPEPSRQPPAPFHPLVDGVGWEDGGMPDPIPPVDLASLAAAGGHPGARWRLDGEELQANLVRLDRGDRIQPHHNDEVEVLVVVVSGRGELTLDGQVHQLARLSSPTCPRGRSERSRSWTGRSLTCRSTAANRRDYSWVDTPGDPDTPKGKPPGRSGGLPLARCPLGTRHVVHDPAPQGRSR